MHARRLFSLFVCAVLLFVATVVAASARAETDEVKFIRIGTGPIGGTYFPVGGLIANAISAPPGAMACDLGGNCGVPGLIAAAVSTQGSVDNVAALTSGRLDLALCQADIAHDAFAAEGAFAGKPPLTTLRTVAALYQEAVHIVVRADSGIDSVPQLKGKRVSVGEANSGTLATARVVLRGFGIRMKDIDAVYEKLSRSAEMLTAGELAALVMVGGQPIAAIAHAAERAPLALLPIAGEDVKRLVQSQPFFVATTIPADTYRGVGATATIGVGAQLLTTSSQDEALVYAITKALWDPRNRKVLDGGNPNAKRIQTQTALDGLSVPLHPGAKRFYAEAGLARADQ